MPLTLQLLPDEFAVCRLPASARVPGWAESAIFNSVTRTADELSIITPAAQIPAGVRHEAGWRVLKFQGPFAFTETGILAAALAPLAAAKISVLATATFDTDYLLVQSAQLEAVRRALAEAGHKIVG
jgi:hypothetical protein